MDHRNALRFQLIIPRSVWFSSVAVTRVIATGIFKRVIDNFFRRNCFLNTPVADTFSLDEHPLFYFVVRSQRIVSNACYFAAARFNGFTFQHFDPRALIVFDGRLMIAGCGKWSGMLESVGRGNLTGLPFSTILPDNYSLCYSYSIVRFQSRVYTLLSLIFRNFYISNGSNLKVCVALDKRFYPISEYFYDCVYAILCFIELLINQMIFFPIEMLLVSMYRIFFTKTSEKMSFYY